MQTVKLDRLTLMDKFKRFLQHLRGLRMNNDKVVKMIV